MKCLEHKSQMYCYHLSLIANRLNMSTAPCMRYRISALFSHIILNIEAEPQRAASPASEVKPHGKTHELPNALDQIA